MKKITESEIYKSCSIVDSRDNLFGTATGYSLDDRGSIPGRGKIFLLSTTSTLALGPTQPNNSIQFFIIYVLSQQPQGQLQTQHSVDKSSYILDEHIIKSRLNKGKHWWKNTLMHIRKQT
jgi:hypothetical protein